MKRVRTNQPQRYHSLMLDMAKQGTFNMAAMIRHYHVGNTVSQSLEQLGYARRMGRGQYEWVAGQPTADDVQKVITFTALQLQKARNKRAGIEPKPSLPLFKDSHQKPATKPQEAVQQEQSQQPTPTPPAKHSLLVHILTLPLLAIIMAIQGLESYFRNLWKAIRR